MATARARIRQPRSRVATMAAGGVVVRDGARGPEVVLAGRVADGSWVFPKGTPDPGETIEETALREVREETGIEVRITRPLGTMEYQFAADGLRVHKVVHFFVMEAIGGDLTRHDAEYDDVRWVPVAEARRMLSFDSYREVLDRVLGEPEAATA